jgi:hypothetical protein
VHAVAARWPASTAYPRARFDLVDATRTAGHRCQADTSRPPAAGSPRPGLPPAGELVPPVRVAVAVLGIVVALASVFLTNRRQ